MESDYSDSTKYDFERMLRKFYKWIKSDDKNTELEEYPPEVKWIKPKKPTREPLSSDEVISCTDVQEMSLYCQNHRDRAFIKSLWESSNRIREHLMLRIGDVKEEEYGLTFDVKTTKAGNKTFQKFLTLSEPDLKEWLQFHPKPDPAAPLWIRIDGRKPNTGIDYDYARKLLRVLGEKAGIKKRLNPHNFRHGSITFWSDYLTDSQLKYRASWSQATAMLGVYIHKDVNAIRDRILQLRGIESKRSESPFENKIIRCYFCGKDNESSRVICYSCKKFLDISKNRVAQRLKDSLDKEIIEFTEKNPEFLMQYLNFLRENHET